MSQWPAASATASVRLATLNLERLWLTGVTPPPGKR